MPDVAEEEAMLACLSTSSMAKLAGLTRQHLRNLHQDGTIDQVSRGKYNAFEVLAALRDRDGDRMTPLKTAQLSLREEQARRQKIDNEIKLGRLVPVDDVHEFQNQVAGFYVRSLESLRKGLGAIVDAALRKRIDGELRQARQELHDRFEAFRRALAGNHPTEAGANTRPVGRRKPKAA